MQTSCQPPIGAVVFDLWKTLVPLPNSVKQAAFNETARVLDEDPHTLAGPWRRTRRRRETEPLGTYMRWLRDELQADWSTVMIEDAMKARHRIHGRMFRRPTRGAVELLSNLRKRGLRTAIVSNASSDVRTMIDGSPLQGAVDYVVLSAEVGVMKPDPKVFQLAAAAIDVPSAHCFFVGDGNDDELDGAAAAGMTPVLFDLGVLGGWEGRRVNHLSDVLREVEPR
jgi:putative hydrolase of the HAD superfamily